MKKEIDFERALLLMQVVVEAGKHGPLYQKLASAAGEELKEMVGFNPVSASVTPAAGPANGLIRQPDGSLAERVQTRSDDTITEEAVVEEPYVEPTEMPVIQRRAPESEVRTGK